MLNNRFETSPRGTEDLSKSQTPTASTTITDRCPDWAVVLIQKIYLLELDTGAIKNLPDSPWSTTTQEELIKIAQGLEQSVGTRKNVDDDAETLFKRLVRGLSSEEFTADEIVGFVNKRVPTGCKLQYCNVSEVLEALA